MEFILYELPLFCYFPPKLLIPIQLLLGKHRTKIERLWQGFEVGGRAVLTGKQNNAASLL